MKMNFRVNALEHIWHSNIIFTYAGENTVEISISHNGYPPYDMKEGAIIHGILKVLL